ncbi:hypothetical protein HYV49_00675 [Candidatus Pacearchaeota archaeon]|nr:hypothetical protein [Candidatus Pacearchaeota archaeon]
MAELSDILKEELLKLSKQIPENLQFVSSLLQSDTQAKLGIETLFSLYNQCSRFLTLADLYEKANLEIQQEREFQNLKKELNDYRAFFQELITDTLT